MSADFEDAPGFIPVPFVADASRREALEQLAASYRLANGLVVLHGAEGCGLTALVAEHLTEMRESHDSGLAALHINARGATVAGILIQILEAMGYPVSDANVNESLALTTIVAQYQADHALAPILAFDNVDDATPPIMKLIAELAAVKQPRQYTYRIVLAGGPTLPRIIESEGMTAVRSRLYRMISIAPMKETPARELIESLLSANRLKSEKKTVDMLWHAGRGLPGRIARLVAESMGSQIPSEDTASTGEHPVYVEPSDATQVRKISAGMDTTVPFDDGGTASLSDVQAPFGEILVNYNGKLLERYVIRRRKVLIGRAPHNDIVLPSRWVSRHHAIIICTPDSANLVDVNSTNGMTVNSRQVRQQALGDCDIVVIGDYRLKYRNERANRQLVDENLSATRVLRSLAPEVLEAVDGAETIADADAKIKGPRKK